MKKLYILILGLIIFANCHSQDWQWSNSISGNGNEKAQLITVDSNGYIYAIIGVSGEVNIGNETYTTNSSTEDNLLVKYSPDNKIVWYKVLSEGISSDYIKKITSDSEANLYIAGYFKNDVLIYEQNYSSTNYNSFILKVDSSGNFKNIKFTSGDGDESINDIYYRNGKIYATGSYQGNMQLDSYSFSSSISTAGTINSSDIFIAIFNSSDFSTIKAVSKGGTPFERGIKIAANDAGEIFVAAYTNTQSTLDGNTIIDTVSFSVSQWNIYFLMKFTPDDIYISGFKNLSLYYDIKGLDVFNDLYVYVGGNSESLGVKDIKLSKFNQANFGIKWQKSLGYNNGGSDAIYDIAVDSKDNIHFTGSKRGVITIDTVSSNSSTGIFYFKLDSLAHVLRFFEYNCSSGYIKSIAIDKDGSNAYISGYFNGSITVGEDSFTSNLNDAILTQIGVGYIAPIVPIIEPTNIYEKPENQIKIIDNKIYVDDAISVSIYSSTGIFISTSPSIANISKGVYIIVAEFSDGSKMTKSFIR